MRNIKSRRTIGAFFDVDGTLINFNTMSSFHWYYYWHRQKRLRLPLIGALEKSLDMLIAFSRLILCMAHAMKKDDRLAVNRRYYASLKGIDVEEYNKLVQQWFANKGIHSEFNRKVVERLKEHQAKRHMVILVSGSHAPLIRPIGIKLGVDLTIATVVETSGCQFTGRILNSDPLVGRGKVNAIKACAEKYAIDLSRSYAYSDHLSDVKMLELVGNPCAIIGDKQLMQYARQKPNWDMIKL